MLKEVVYWTYYFFEKKLSKRLKDWNWWESMMFVALCLCINTMSIIYIIEYYTNSQILTYLPITSRWDLLSWVLATLIYLPFVIYIYFRYYKQPKLSKLKKSYASKSRRRLAVGRLFYFGYCLITWVSPFIVYYFF